MNGNRITEWSYDLPAEPGLYIACYGDIEVPQNMMLASLRKDPNRGVVDQYGQPLTKKYIGYKWARLLIGSDAK